MPRLVRAGDVAGLVLHPGPTGLREPEGLAQARAARERRDREAVPVDRGDRVVEAPARARRRPVGEAAGPGQVVRVEQLAVPDEGVRSPGRPGSGRSTRSSSRRRHVVDVVATVRVRAAEGCGVPGVRRRAAAGADEPAEASRSQRLQDAGPGVEIVDQVVPAGDDLAQPAPEAGSRRCLEVLERDALLLDPGVVAEVEDALAIGRVRARGDGRSPSRAGARRRPPPRRARRTRRRSTSRSRSRARCRTSPRRPWRR